MNMHGLYDRYHKKKTNYFSKKHKKIHCMEITIDIRNAPPLPLKLALLLFFVQYTVQYVVHCTSPPIIFFIMVRVHHMLNHTNYFQWSKLTVLWNFSPRINLRCESVATEILSETEADVTGNQSTQPKSSSRHRPHLNFVQF